MENSEHLDPQLKEQLTALEADPAMLEDAFICLWNLGLLACEGF